MTTAPDGTATTRTHRLLGDPSRARVLQILESSARPLAAAEVASAVGLHPTTARFHLELLTDAGLTQRSIEVRTSRGRPRTLYATAPAEEAAGSSYQQLAEVLAERLSGPGGAASATSAGFSWGQRLQPAADMPMTAEASVGRLREVLTDAGFAPAVTARGDLILQQCPFIDAARRNPEIVCSVHLGLAQGVLHQLRAPLSAVALRPEMDGPHCYLRLEPADL